MNRGMKNAINTPRREQIPDVCDACGQRIDRNNPASIEYHTATPKHLPFTGKRKRRPAWM